MIKQVTVKGYFEENCFFCIDEETGHGFLIDPGAQARRLLALIRENGWTIEKILLTHGHFDHIGAVEEISSRLEIPVLAHRNADEYLMDDFMNLSSSCGSPITFSGAEKAADGEIIALESDQAYSLKAIFAPGHTRDSMIFYSLKENAAFVGDTIFKGSPGEYRYPGGDLEDLERTIIRKVFTLPADTVLYSGHSDPTTVGAEMRRYGLTPER